MKIEKFLRLAKEQAILSVLKEKHGAVVVKKNKIISYGKNSPKTHPKQKIYNLYQEKNPELMHHYIHAEFEALNKIPESVDLSDAVIYAYKVKKDGSCSISRPCQACLNYIFDRGITQIVYSTKQGWTQEELKKEDIEVLKKNKKNKNKNF